MAGGGKEWIDRITKKGIDQKGSGGHPAPSFFMRSCHKGFGQAWLGEKGTAAALTGVMVEGTAMDPCIDEWTSMKALDPGIPALTLYCKCSIIIFKLGMQIAIESLTE